MTLLLQLNLGFAWGEVATIDTAGTIEAGWAFSVPATTWQYEVPSTKDMSFSAPQDMLHFDSPVR